MKKILLPLFVLTQFIFADPPNWDFNPMAFEYQMSLTARAYDVNGSDIGSPGDIVGAFYLDQLRGVAEAYEVPPFLGGGYAFLIQIYENDALGNQINFQFYDADQDMVYHTYATLVFDADSVVGDLTDPFHIGINPYWECEDDDIGAWESIGVFCFEAGGEWCGWGPMDYYCPETCGFCDDCASDVYDCAGECDGDTTEDCAGDCGGTADYDECGVCNGPGAIYECGCSDAVENYDCDENCVVDIDCAGTCGGSAVLDECGVCNGSGIAEGACDCDGNTLDDCSVCGGEADGSDCNYDGVDDVCEDEYDTGFESGFFEGQLTGDANHDGELNIVDIVIFIDNILND